MESPSICHSSGSQTGYKASSFTREFVINAHFQTPPQMNWSWNTGGGVPAPELSVLLLKTHYHTLLFIRSRMQWDVMEITHGIQKIRVQVTRPSFKKASGFWGTPKLETHCTIASLWRIEIRKGWKQERKNDKEHVRLTLLWVGNYSTFSDFVYRARLIILI